MHQFDVILSGRIEIRATIDAMTEAEAREEAERRMRSGVGVDISEVTVEQNVLMDEEGVV